MVESMIELRSAKKPGGALERSRMYALLSTVCLKQPTQELISFYRDAAESLNGLPGLNLVESYLKDTKDSSAREVSEALSASFTKFFRGLVPYIPPPYESVYKGEQLFGAATDNVIQAYRSFSMELGDSYKGEPPDYLGFELDFMRFLCEREAEALDKEDSEKLQHTVEAEKRFLEEHLLTWIRRFQDIVRRFDDKGFYMGWIDFTEYWLRRDYERVCSMVGDTS